ncbi:MAG: deoxyribodipyrimidine photolyase [Pelagibacterales bacterium]|nr:deoxyribodipyrimidine photolyase [Pelagibacterales bacterium]
MNDPCICWFRKDLRLDDNPALLEASKHKKIIPLFIFDKSIEEYKDIGEASHWWLENSLLSLNLNLDNKLNILEGNSLVSITKIIKEQNIKYLYWNRCYEPDRIAADTIIKNSMKDLNVIAKSFNSSLLWEPWKIKNKSGNFYKVFTPFYKKGCLVSDLPRKPIEKPEKLFFLKLDTESQNYHFKFKDRKYEWCEKFEKIWNTSEASARTNFNNFLNTGASDYSEGRNFPSKNSVSKISPYLHWGQISPFRVWQDAKNKMKGQHKETFLSELGWREFSYHLLYHYPNINKKNLKPQFDKLEWNVDEKLLLKWKKGKTGFPIVDAGMRELWQTGYMHNRLRMITASFLVKNLLIHWKEGEKWFWDCLLDADLASNSASWQWVAGTGSDAAPFFRIFNPITQGQKFDKDAVYIRKYLPEIAKLPNKFIFTPWLAEKTILKEAGIKLGINYPYPIVDYTLSRKRALDAFKKISN